VVGRLLSHLGYDQYQGLAKNYAAFKIAFKQHYGIGGATNNLCWADTFRQRSDEVTHTSADLFGSMADETERELSTAQGAGGMGPAHGQAPPEAAHTSADLFGSMSKSFYIS
jgi:hypothetical protein